jgi:hypothetical protein
MSFPFLSTAALLAFVETMGTLRSRQVVMISLMFSGSGDSLVGGMNAGI